MNSFQEMVGPNNSLCTGCGSLLVAGQVPAVHVGAELTAASMQWRWRGASGWRMARTEARGGTCGWGHVRAHGCSVCRLG